MGEGCLLQGCLTLRAAGGLLPSTALVGNAAPASARILGGEDKAGVRGGEEGVREVEVEMSVERGRRLKNVGLGVVDDAASGAADVVQMIAFAQQRVYWNGSAVLIHLGMIAWFRKLWGQLAISVESACGLQVPESLAGVPSVCLCRISLDGRHFDTAGVRASMLSSEDVAAHKAAVEQASSADNWRELEAKSGSGTGGRVEDELLVGARAVWNAHFMLGVSTACFNDAQDARIEAAYGLRLTIIMVADAADSTSHMNQPLPHATTTNPRQPDTQVSTIASLKIDLKTLLGQPPQETRYELALPRDMRDGESGATGGAIKVRMWLQEQGMEGGRASGTAKINKGLSKAAVVNKMGAGLGRDFSQVPALSTLRSTERAHLSRTAVDDTEASAAQASLPSTPLASTASLCKDDQSSTALDTSVAEGGGGRPQELESPAHETQSCQILDSEPSVLSNMDDLSFQHEAASEGDIRALADDAESWQAQSPAARERLDVSAANGVESERTTTSKCRDKVAYQIKTASILMHTRRSASAAATAATAASLSRGSTPRGSTPRLSLETRLQQAGLRWASGPRLGLKNRSWQPDTHSQALFSLRLAATWEPDDTVTASGKQAGASAWRGHVPAEQELTMPLVPIRLVRSSDAKARRGTLAPTTKAKSSDRSPCSHSEQSMVLDPSAAAVAGLRESLARQRTLANWQREEEACDGWPLPTIWGEGFSDAGRGHWDSKQQAASIQPVPPGADGGGESGPAAGPPSAKHAAGGSGSEAAAAQAPRLPQLPHTGDMLRVSIPTPRLGVRESFSKPAPRELVVLVMFGQHDRSVGENLSSALKQVVSRHLAPPELTFSVRTSATLQPRLESWEGCAVFVPILSAESQRDERSVQMLALARSRKIAMLPIICGEDMSEERLHPRVLHLIAGCPSIVAVAPATSKQPSSPHRSDGGAHSYHAPLLPPEASAQQIRGGQATARPRCMPMDMETFEGLASDFSSLYLMREGKSAVVDLKVVSRSRLNDDDSAFRVDEDALVAGVRSLPLVSAAARQRQREGLSARLVKTAYLERPNDAEAEEWVVACCARVLRLLEAHEAQTLARLQHTGRNMYVYHLRQQQEDTAVAEPPAQAIATAWQNRISASWQLHTREVLPPSSGISESAFVSAVLKDGLKNSAKPRRKSTNAPPPPAPRPVHKR